MLGCSNRLPLLLWQTSESHFCLCGILSVARTSPMRVLPSSRPKWWASAIRHRRWSYTGLFLLSFVCSLVAAPLCAALIEPGGSDVSRCVYLVPLPVTLPISPRSDDCALFCMLLSEMHDNGTSFAPFRVPFEGHMRVHVFPCIKGDPFEISELSLAVEHPGSLLSFHVEAGAGAYTLHARLRALVPDAPSWFILHGPADGDLVLPIAWDTAVTAKQSGLYHTPQLHAYVISHGQHTAEDVIQELARERALSSMLRRPPCC